MARSPEDFGEEDEYFAEGEVEIDGITITPSTATVHTWPNHAYDQIIYLNVDGIEDGAPITPIELAIYKDLGFVVLMHGENPNESQAAWVEHKLLENVDREIEDWYRQHP